MSMIMIITYLPEYFILCRYTWFFGQTEVPAFDTEQTKGSDSSASNITRVSTETALPQTASKSSSKCCENTVGSVEKKLRLVFCWIIFVNNLHRIWFC